MRLDERNKAYALGDVLKTSCTLYKTGKNPTTSARKLSRTPCCILLFIIETAGEGTESLNS